MTAEAGRDHGQETRQRILRAATRIFAELGFHQTTVREICQSAEVNVAAINYHFRDKEGLYLEVLRAAHARANRVAPLQPEGVDKATAEDRLRGFVRAICARIFDVGPDACHGQLMSHEMVRPTRALDEIVETEIRPKAMLLMGIIREIVGPEPPDEAVRAVCYSIIGQCLFYKNCRPVVERLMPENVPTPEDMEAIAEHIVEFSLHGIRGLTKKKECWWQRCIGRAEHRRKASGS